MLQVLKFKKSLFEGVLDGGEKEVFLGGSRLNKFMEQVEEATAAIPEELLEDAEDALVAPADEAAGPAGPTGPGPRPGRGRRGRRPPAPVLVPAGLDGEHDEEPVAAAVPSVVGDPWSALLQTGMALLQQVVSAARNGNGTAGPGQAQQAAGPARTGVPRVARDEKTGETYLRLPMPSPQVLDQALNAIGTFLRGLRQ
jgi:hypothetical protein